jgi:hypothetical protein
MAAAALRSVILRRGLEGLSRKSARVLGLRAF